MHDVDTNQTIKLDPVAQEEYDTLGLPNTSPGIFYQALAATLSRLPLIEAHAESGMKNELANRNGVAA